MAVGIIRHSNKINSRSHLDEHTSIQLRPWGLLPLTCACTSMHAHTHNLNLADQRYCIYNCSHHPGNKSSVILLLSALRISSKSQILFLFQESSPIQKKKSSGISPQIRSNLWERGVRRNFLALRISPRPQKSVLIFLVLGISPSQISFISFYRSLPKQDLLASIFHCISS